MLGPDGVHQDRADSQGCPGIQFSDTADSPRPQPPSRAGRGDDHGSADTLTAEKFERAAVAVRVSPQQVAQNISAIYDHAETDNPMTWPTGNPTRG